MPQTNLSLFRVCVLLAAFGLAVYVLRERRRGRLAWSELRGIAPFAAAVALAVGWLLYESWRSLWALGHTLAAGHAFLLVGVIVLAAAMVLRIVRPTTMLTAAALSAVAPFAFALYQALAPGSGEEKAQTPVPLSGLLEAEEGSDQLRAGVASGGAFRPASVFSDPNFLAIFAVGTLILADPDHWGSGPRQRRALQALRVVAVLVTLLTLSRTGMLVLVSYGLVRYGPAAWRRVRPRGPRRVAVLAAIAVVVAVVVAGGLITIGSVRNTTVSTDSHVATIRDALDLWWTYPLNGAGIGNYGWAFGQKADRSSAQSFPFTILAEQGLIGASLLLAVVWGPALRLVKRFRRIDVAPLGLIFLVGAWFYDFALVLDVCAVFLAILVAAWNVEDLRPAPLRSTR